MTRDPLAAVREQVAQEPCPVCEGRLTMVDVPRRRVLGRDREVVQATCTGCPAEVWFDAVSGALVSFIPNQVLTVARVPD